MVVADPDESRRVELAALLRSSGYAADEAARSQQVVGHVARQRVSALLLHDEMPALDGKEMLVLLRQVCDVPILVFGGGEAVALIGALLKGADAYVTVPCEPAELLGRVHAVLRRAGPGHVGPSGNGEAAPPGEPLHDAIKSGLTDTESRLLRCLMECRDRLVGRHELMSAVWGRTVSGELLRFYVHSLRRKLQKGSGLDVETRRGVGYRLVGAGV